MSVNSNTYVANGTSRSFLVTYAQYSWTTNKVYLNGVLNTTGWSYDSVTKSIVFASPPAKGAVVHIRRSTTIADLYSFGSDAAFTGSNLDTNFKIISTAAEDVSDAATVSYVDAAVAAEEAARVAADASLQSQISGSTPAIGAELATVTWHNRMLSNSVTVPSGMNAFSVGPQLIIAPGQVVTLEGDATWAVLGNAFEADDLYNVTADKLHTSDDAHVVLVDNIAAVVGSGVVDVAHGGTGSTTPEAARVALGAAPVAGVTDASSAAAGEVGEYLEVTGSAVTLTASTNANLVSLTLTPGDWEVTGSVFFSTTMSLTSITASLNTVSATQAAAPLRLQVVQTLGNTVMPVVTRRFNVSTSTTVYLVGAAGFASGTSTGTGYIAARRVR